MEKLQKQFSRQEFAKKKRGIFWLYFEQAIKVSWFYWVFIIKFYNSITIADCDLSNRQEMNFFKQILQQKVSWLLS